MAIDLGVSLGNRGSLSLKGLGIRSTKGQLISKDIFYCVNSSKNKWKIWPKIDPEGQGDFFLFFVHFFKNWQQRGYRLKLTAPFKGGWVSRPRHVSVCWWSKVHFDEVEMRFFAWLLRWKWWTPRLSPSYLSSQTVHLSRKSKMYSTWVSLTDFLTFLLVWSFRIFNLKNCKL